MNTICKWLIDQAKALYRFPTADLPNPCIRLQQGLRHQVGTCNAPVYAMAGSERQFNRWSSEILRLLLYECSHATSIHSMLWERQFPGLVGQAEQFFRTCSNAPSLVWTSPIFPRAINWLTEEGLTREDRTLTIRRYKLPHVASSPRIPVVFPSDGSRHEVDVSKLQFHYPHRPQFFATVPRIRTIVYPDGLSSPRDECVALADFDEVRRLEAGDYLPNAAFHRVEGGVKFLDFFTITLARLRIPSSRQATVRGIDLNRQKMAPATRINVREAELSVPGQVLIDPADVLVQFLRVTFEPTTQAIVVFLTAERRFDRFFKEHAGLQEALTSAMLDGGYC